MKKLLALFLLVFALTLCGCENNEQKLVKSYIDDCLTEYRENTHFLYYTYEKAYNGSDGESLKDLYKIEIIIEYNDWTYVDTFICGYKDKKMITEKISRGILASPSA